MLIIGAKGFAKEVLEICHQQNDLKNIAFYDDVNKDIGTFLFDIFPVLKSEKEVRDYFKTVSHQFTVGIGNPILRYKLMRKFISFGGVYSSTISPKAEIGSYGNVIGDGSNIMTNTVITNDVKIREGALINLLCTIGHDVLIEKFVELCPSVNVSGNCTIGAFTFIGTNSVVLPNINIGKNVIIGAGSVVTKDIPDNTMALGAPAKVIKQLEPFIHNLDD